MMLFGPPRVEPKGDGVIEAQAGEKLERGDVVRIEDGVATKAIGAISGITPGSMHDALIVQAKSLGATEREIMMAASAEKAMDLVKALLARNAEAMSATQRKT